MLKFVKAVFVGSILSLAIAAPAAAQGQLGVGASFLRVQDGDETGKGFAVDYAAPVAAGKLVSIVADLGWNKFEFVKTTSFQGGVRVGTHTGPVRPFVQFLVGGVRFSQSGFSETDLVYSPGVGVNIALGDDLAIRAQYDFMRIDTEVEATNANRFWFGLALGR